MVGLGASKFELDAIPEETFRITPPPTSQSTSNANIFIDLLIGVFGAVASALSGGALAPLIIGVAETAAITLTDYEITGKVDVFNTVASVIGIGTAEVNIIKGVRLADQTTAIASKVDSALVQAGSSSLERNVMKTSIEGVVSKQLGAKQLTNNLVRAGMTEEAALVELKRLSNILKEQGVNAKRFQNEVDFVNQETNIFSKVIQPLKELGLDPNDLFTALKNGGIDIVGIRESSDLVKAFRSSNVIYQDLQDAGLIEELEKILERDIEPTVFTRILNAQKLEKGITKLNKIISFVNPNKVITEVANKIFDPIKDKIEEKISKPFKKKIIQKLKHLVKQDIVRKKQTKNGVYPCFGSGWINYLRAVPLGAGRYKCFVVFRRWGYQPVLITPPLDLDFIINWSESSSPGRIYHRFRREYGQTKGMVDSKVDSNNPAYQIFNLLGFIPDKYISLGVSLIGNITTAVSVISQDMWGDFAENKAQYLSNPIRDKILEIGGGELGKAIYAQKNGNRGAVQSYFEGKVKTIADAKQSAFRASGREGKGKVDAVRGISGVIK